MKIVVKADDDLMTPAEVAAVFGVQSKTVAAWARAGRLASVRTLGGHRRYRREDVRRLLDQQQLASVPSPEAPRGD